MTITEFRRRFGISPARWSAMVAAGSTPAIGKDNRGRSVISEESAQAWRRRKQEKANGQGH